MKKLILIGLMLISTPVFAADVTFTLTIPDAKVESFQDMLQNGRVGKRLWDAYKVANPEATDAQTSKAVLIEILKNLEASHRLDKQRRAVTVQADDNLIQ